MQTHHVTTNPQTKLTDFGCRLLSSILTITLYYYYSVPEDDTHFTIQRGASQHRHCSRVHSWCPRQPQWLSW